MKLNAQKIKIKITIKEQIALIKTIKSLNLPDVPKVSKSISPDALVPSVKVKLIALLSVSFATCSMAKLFCKAVI